jgi:hypothetical protein
MIMICPNMDSTLERPADDAMLGPEGETRGREKDMMGEKEGREGGKEKKEGW